MNEWDLTYPLRRRSGISVVLQRGTLFFCDSPCKVRSNDIHILTIYESEMLFCFYVPCIGTTFIYTIKIVEYDIHIVRIMVYLYLNFKRKLKFIVY